MRRDQYAVEDAFCMAGVKAIAMTVICLVFWAVGESLEAQILTWLFMALQLVALIGAWTALGWRVGFFQRRASQLLQRLRVRR